MCGAPVFPMSPKYLFERYLRGQQTIERVEPTEHFTRVSERSAIQLPVSQIPVVDGHVDVIVSMLQSSIDKGYLAQVSFSGYCHLIKLGENNPQRQYDSLVGKLQDNKFKLAVNKGGRLELEFLE